MKSTGITRKVDELGRIVLPKELRRTLGINEKDPIEIFVEDTDKIVLKKYEPYGACVITGEVSKENFVVANGKIIVSKKGAEQLIEELERFVVRS
ncbi:AbrB family transcriptional regulator [Bacillus pseudomycoides]|uniref:AbrB/MazE/SpoVT family DNA-binding domain-containing protein n=1 Tax=Bacillus pseudomycoides TaxID=64104 RepID=UPI000BEDB50F|nr:AbrB/MazE/SpoVT family DNA-binding domain-containing protein [Bacillus pseudomycoides]PDY14127.1 AbrB family transcriptional regulator [Bacillus pseudomycoides]